MANIGGGVWQTLVGGAAPGDAYTYRFNGSSIVRLDPRAQGIGNGTTAWPYSIVHNPDFGPLNAAGFSFAAMPGWWAG